MLEEIKLLVGGREAFDNIISNINHARKYIKVNMFIWRDDEIGNEMAIAIINAANRGVKINISKDKLGMVFEYAEEYKHSFFHHKLFTRWYLQGVILDKIYPMEGKTGRLKRDVNPNFTKMVKHKNIMLDYNRVKMDHSKYYIFDGEILILGGVNIEDKEVTTDVSGMAYHDYMVEIRDKEIVKLFKQRLYGNKEYSSETEIEFIFNRVIYGKKDFQVKASIIDLLNRAKESVDIVMAYIGDPEINDCITQLINKGVKVTLYLSNRANLQQDLNMKNLKDLMIKTDNRIHIYLCEKMIHAKLIRIDQNIMTVGSTNLNNQAMEVLLELNIVINNTRYNKNLEDVFLKLEESFNSLKDSSTKIEDSSMVSYNPIQAYLESLV